MLRVAVGEEVGREDVALHRARGQARRGPDALDVHDDRRDLGVVPEADEFRHERDAGPDVVVIAARPGPARPDHHAERRELVLGLDDRAGGLPGLGIHAEPAGSSP